MFNAYSSLAVPTINKPRSQQAISPKSKTRRQVGISPISSPHPQRLRLLEMGGEVRDEHIQGNTNPNLQDETVSCTCVCPKGRIKEESSTLFSPSQEKGPRHFQYENDKMFKTALKMYNRRMKNLDVGVTNGGDNIENGAADIAGSGVGGSSGSGVGSVIGGKNYMKVQRWECKGEIQACFQLCVSCRDVGKMKNYRESYYLDVLEVSKYRTILCKSCLGYLLKQTVGCCFKGSQNASCT